MGHPNTFNTPLPHPQKSRTYIPNSDGKPMAETERHFRELLKIFIVSKTILLPFPMPMCLGI